MLFSRHSVIVLSFIIFSVTIFMFVSADNDQKAGQMSEELDNLSNESHDDTHSHVLQHKVIILDAGHGGDDVGAIGANGIYEKELTHKTTQRLEAVLQIFGAHVIVTRKEDTYIRLGSRTSFANLYEADAVISIHYNSFPEEENVEGISTFYHDSQSQYLARAVQGTLIQETEAVDRGIHHGDFQVLRESVNPAILLELGFISNEPELKRLLTHDYQDKLVGGIVKGLMDYVSTRD